MASTYTGLGTELMTTGENASTWGTKTNTNLNIIEQISGGYIEKSIAGSAQTTTLSVSDGSTGAVLAHRIIEFTGTITGNQVVTIPLDVQTFYIMKNNTSGAYTVQFKYVSGSGSSVTWAATDKGTKLLYATADDGTNPNLVDSNIGGVGTYDLDGGELTLDADSDTSITASSDDQIDFEINGADDFTMTANAFNVLTGSHATFADSANAKFGTGNDMLVYHDGSNSYITNATGALKLATETSGIALTIGHTTSETTIADNLTVTGDADIGGTTNLDAVDIDGAVQIDGAVTVGVDDTGLDVKFFGASAGAYALYDQSADLLDIRGATAAGAGLLKLTTGELTVVDADILGRIDFQAPLESDGTDAILVAASIYAEADDTFAAGVNNTDIVFATGKSETAAEKFRFTADNEIGVAGANYGTDGQVLTSGGAGAAVAWEDAASSAADDISVGDAAVTIGNGSTSADITIDSGDDVVIDAAGGNVEFKDAGTLQLSLDMDGTSGVQIIKLGVNADDLVFQQYDGNEVMRINDDRKLYFYDDGGENISSDGTDFTFASGNDINLTATTDINVPSGVGMTFGNDGEKIEGDGTDLTIAGNNINLTAVADVVIPANVGITFGSGEKIEGDSTDLTITSGAKINLTATSDVVIPANVGITFGTGEKIEGDSTDLTITSGADIGLSATADINVPSGVGMTFGNDGEKIEGDGTDLTILSSGVLNFAAGGTTNQVKVTDGTITPLTDNDIDLGTSSLEFKNVYVDGVVYTDAIGFGTVVMELPVADGSDGQVLETDGSGNLDWVSVTGTVTAINNATANELVPMVLQQQN